MDTLDLIYNILVGEKVYEGDDAWHVYDKWGSELSDPGGVMWRANPGALIMWPRPEVETAPGGGLTPWQRSLFKPLTRKHIPYNEEAELQELAELLMIARTYG